MKTKRGISYNSSYYFEYEINGSLFWIQGELYYNKKKERYEYEHIGTRGGEVLIFWTEKEKVN